MNIAATSTSFTYTCPQDAVQAFIAKLKPVDEVQVPLERASGLILSRSVGADRDSPPHDVSAMDGYAIRMDQIDATGTVLEVIDEIAIGQPAKPMPRTGCLKISTGACVPGGCDGIVPREKVDEKQGRIVIPAGLSFKQGQHIRRRGENIRRGSAVLTQGTPITGPAASALAAFGHKHVWVHRPVRVALLTTGNELMPVDSNPAEWQIRDSNSAALQTGLSAVPWIAMTSIQRISDDLDAISDALATQAQVADLIITTGGVSMGDHDYLRPALINRGGQVIYHKLPIRPGKPSLGGLIRNNTDACDVPVLALPGNPVAVVVGLSLFVSPVARALAGHRQSVAVRPRVEIINPPVSSLNLWHYLPAKLIEPGRAEVIKTLGSGDLVGAATADGFVEIPPGAQGRGPWLFYDATL